MPRSLQWMDLYQIWFRGSPRGLDQMCGILLQSAHGFRFCEGSKFAISHWLGRSPLTQYWRYRAACDLRDAHTVDAFDPIRFSSESRHVIHDGTFTSTRLYTLTAVNVLPDSSTDQLACWSADSHVVNRVNFIAIYGLPAVALCLVRWRPG